jgi:predicted anti-sigma-YlaC factor YlaD
MKIESNIKCSKARKLMSSYIDCMAEPEESRSLEFHLDTCEPCQRQLHSYISLRSMMASVEPVRPPEDLVMDTRVRLSHARSGGLFDRIEGVMVNVLKPMVIPAVSGIALTVLSFGLLFGNIAMNLQAQDLNSSLISMEEPVRITDQTMLSAPGNSGSDWLEPLSVKANVDYDGRVYEIRILSGSQTPAVKHWIQNLLYTAQFAPATRLGKPINSSTILTFVNVRS